MTPTKICLRALNIGKMCGEKTPHAIFLLLRNSLVTTHQQNTFWAQSALVLRREGPHNIFTLLVYKLAVPMSAFELSLLVTAEQCQQSVNCIESEWSSHFLNASTEGGTTPTKISFTLHGRATWGSCRQVIWGFNTNKKVFGRTRH